MRQSQGKITSPDLLKTDIQGLVGVMVWVQASINFWCASHVGKPGLFSYNSLLCIKVLVAMHYNYILS